MSRLPFICAAALAGVCAASLFVTVVRAEDQTTDIGTLDKEMAEKTFPAQAALFAICRSQFSEADKFPHCSAEREALVKKAQQAETALRLDSWANSPGLQPPD